MARRYGCHSKASIPTTPSGFAASARFTCALVSPESAPSPRPTTRCCAARLVRSVAAMKRFIARGCCPTSRSACAARDFVRVKRVVGKLWLDRAYGRIYRHYRAELIDKTRSRAAHGTYSASRAAKTCDTTDSIRPSSENGESTYDLSAAIGSP